MPIPPGVMEDDPPSATIPSTDGLPDPRPDDDQLVLVDFDHTLLAGNSTELFIAHCQPGLIVAIIDAAVRRGIPWRLTRLPHVFRLRDYTCVLAICLLMPWNIWRWQRIAPALFAGMRAGPIADWAAAIDPRRLVIVSFGVRPVIRAMLRGSDLSDATVLATPGMVGPRWFAQGKADIALRSLPADDIARATFVTDSLDDADLLAAVGDGRLIAPRGIANRAREGLYLPLRYCATVKFTRSFAMDQWLLVDSLLAVLTVGQGLLGMAHMLVIAPLMTLSFMCVYEQGYFENDMVACRRETNPTLSGKEHRFRNYPIVVNSWIWAIALAVAGLTLAHMLGEAHGAGIAGMTVAWLGVLVLARVVFAVYNRLPTERRMLVYPLLQLTKYGSIMALFPATAVGAVLAGCQLATMWCNYAIYRLGGDTKRLPKEAFRAVLFGCAAVLMLLSGTFGHGAALDPRQRIEVISLAMAAVWLGLRMAKATIMRRVRAA